MDYKANSLFRSSHSYHPSTTSLFSSHRQPFSRPSARELQPHEIKIFSSFEDTSRPRQTIH